MRVDVLKELYGGGDRFVFQVVKDLVELGLGVWRI